MLHFVFNEMEIPNKRELDSGDLGIERKLFYREMIARFGHYNGVQWNLSEEYQPGKGRPADLYSIERIREFADYIKAVDPFNYPLTVHNAWIKPDDPFYGDSRFDLTSVQYRPEWMRANGGKPDFAWYGNGTENMRNYSRDAGRPLPIMMDEFCTTKAEDDETHSIDIWDKVSGQIWVRKHVLYPIYFSGGQIEFILEGLLATDDLALYEGIWRYT